MLRPSFASHSLSTFPPGGRLYLLPYLLGFPFGEALPRSGGGEVPLGFPLRAFLAELPFQGSVGSLAVRAADWRGQLSPLYIRLPLGGKVSPNGDEWGAQHIMRSPFLIFWIFRKEFLKNQGAHQLQTIVCSFPIHKTWNIWNCI